MYIIECNYLKLDSLIFAIDTFL